MTNEELQQLVCGISKNVFGKDFKHEAYFNSRLQTTGGRYLLRTHNIELNPKALEKYGVEELEGIIRHELCHYHLHIEGKGYKHRDSDFRKLLKETNSPRFCSNLREANKRERKIRYIYSCTNCGLVYKRKNKLDTKKYRCGKCLSVIKLKELVQ